jgi:hypothetical protein
MTTSNRIELLSFLRGSHATAAAQRLLKRTMQQIVLEYGWWYEPCGNVQDCGFGTPQQCHTNAADLVLADDSLFYCEGYALAKGVSQPTLHAWVTDGTGRAIDNTWATPGVAYAGVPFQSQFWAMTALNNRATISLLDDWENGYPLRGDLGDRSDEWLELRGRGTARLNGEQDEP